MGPVQAVPEPERLPPLSIQVQGIPPLAKLVVREGKTRRSRLLETAERPGGITGRRIQLIHRHDIHAGPIETPDMDRNGDDLFQQRSGTVPLLGIHVGSGETQGRLRLIEGIFGRTERVPCTPQI